MKKLLGASTITAMLLLGSIAFAQTNDQNPGTASASSTIASPVFPIAELGGCDSKDSCHAYCEDATHASSCLTYAQAHNLMTKEKIAAARDILAKKGPGGCSSADSCRTYCADSSHQDECMKFAQDKKIITDDKVLLIKKLTTGEGPGACKSADSCSSYCKDSSHQTECRNFAEENGLVRKIGSSTMPLMRIVGSSTREAVKDILASTTPGRERGMELHDIHSSTTPPGILKNAASTTPPGAGEIRKQLPPTPPQPKSSMLNDSLGASVMHGFAKMLGF